MLKPPWDLSLEYGMAQSIISSPIHGLAQCCILMDTDWALDEKDR